MSRTTLEIEDDALVVARKHAALHRLTLGEAVSDLVRRAAERPLVTDGRNGLTVLRLGRDAKVVTSELVNRLRDDTP